MKGSRSEGMTDRHNDKSGRYEQGGVEGLTKTYECVTWCCRPIGGGGDSSIIQYDI